MFGRASERRVPVTSTNLYPAPTKGWVQTGNLGAATGDQAEVLDNFVVTAEGARLRGGKQRVGDLGASVEQLFSYNSGSVDTLFGATDGDIFDISDIAGGAVKTGTTSGDWSTTQLSTAGGVFLIGVNGADVGFTYNGTTFSDLAVNNVSEADLSQVWTFKERVFFVEVGTQSAWYLDPKSIGGDAAELNMGSVFRRGGTLLFGATWSLDSGSGLDDVCLFVSDNGEVAVYQGTNPASAATWGLSGVYDIGIPMNKHSYFKAGGDLAVVTRDGIIPISSAVQKDRAALRLDSISYPIEDAWKAAMASGGTFPTSATLWQSAGYLLVGTGAATERKPIAFVSNANTGAWSRITGWDVRCSGVFDDRLYFGSESGCVFLADSTGSDDGEQYTGVYVGKFKHSESLTSANSVGVTYKATQELDFDLLAFGDYNITDITAPNVTLADSTGEWGQGEWGAFIWGETTNLTSYTTWQSVFANGYATAPGLSITSNQDVAVVFEITVTRLRSEGGYAL